MVKYRANAHFELSEYLEEQGVLMLNTPEFDIDTFPEVAQAFLSLLSASLIESQQDADMYTWLIDFEGTRMFLKAEHYSGSIWLEALNRQADRDVFDYLANLLADGLAL